ncbi:MAG: glycosyltransferase [Marinilabiliaceae bacterium]|nr:glycosyltransferase [Marinilabiliaceae bacterium]
MPKVSIIIPTYKRPNYLIKTLENIHQQTFKDFEVIVVDDGTPGDENAQICAQFPKVVYKKIDNSGGPMIPRNTGFKIAKGEYIALIDDDDLWVNDKLEQQVKILDENRDFGVVHGCCKEIDNQGNETGKIHGKINDFKRKHGYVFDDMIGNFTLMTPTVFFRKELLEKVGYFKETMHAAGEDMEFYCRLAFYSKLYFIEEPIAFYRFHNQNISNDTEKIGYNYLPLELFFIVKDLKEKGLISNKQFKLMRKRLLYRQATFFSITRKSEIVKANCKKIYKWYWTIPKIILPLLFYNKKNNRLKRVSHLLKKISVKFKNSLRLLFGKHTIFTVTDLFRVTPLSTCFGFDRGKPIDRYYIEKFLYDNRQYFKGRILEVAQDWYSSKYAALNKTNDEKPIIETLHLDGTEKKVTIVGDLTNLQTLPENRYDCFVCTQVLHVIYDVSAALEGAYKLLKEGGVFLATTTGISQICRGDMDRWGDYWRFTNKSLELLFQKTQFKEVEIVPMGNVLAACAFLQGLALEELPKKELLDIIDDNYQLIIGIKAVK